MRNAIVSIAFQANKEAIVAEFCVQKDFVKNTCQGQCHLRDVLESVNEEEDDSERTSSFNFQVEENIIPNQNVFVALKEEHSAKITFPSYSEGLLLFTPEFNPPPPKV